MIDRELPTYTLGYAIDRESKPLLQSQGMDPRKMLGLVRDNKPDFNVDTDPMTLFEPLNQGNQGACQGHALAMMFTISTSYTRVASKRSPARQRTT